MRQGAGSSGLAPQHNNWGAVVCGSPALLGQHSHHAEVRWAICDVSGDSQQQAELTVPGSSPRAQTVHSVTVATPAFPGERRQTE